MRSVCLVVAAVFIALACCRASGDTTVRVATFDLQGVRTGDLADAANPRLRRLAEVIQRVRPNVILLTGIAYDTPGAPDVKNDGPPGQNARRFAEAFLARAQATDTQALHFKAFTAPTNSGMHSGLDLDHDGKVTDTIPLPGSPADEALAYSGDSWGPGSYPGERGMALLVDDRLQILDGQVRTFRLFPWDYIPGAAIPGEPKSDLTPEERKVFRLSSTSHWDVPVRLPDGAIIHVLCSNPAPPDSPRASRRHHDELRFWTDYVDATGGGGYIVDDADHAGPLGVGEHFVILGNLGADPKRTAAYKSPVGLLLSAPRVNATIIPKATIEGADSTDTTGAKLRFDYVLPSRDLPIKAAGVWRTLPTGSDSFPSDHLPVWMDLVVPAPTQP